MEAAHWVEFLSSVHGVLCYISVVLAFKKQKQVIFCDLGASLV